MEYECEVETLLTAEEITARDPHPGPNILTEPLQGEEWAVYVVLTNGKVFGCDLVVSATGTYPNTSCLVNQRGEMEVSGW